MRRLLLAALLVACSPVEPPDADPEPRSFTLLHTSDEHGALFPTVLQDGALITGGAAEVLGAWQAEGAPSPDHLILSSGDLWVGDIESTVLEGEPTVEAMNRMGYAAAALGNHEFDLGQDVLAERLAQADFAFLAADLDAGDTGLEIAPYSVITRGDVQIGIIGISPTIEGLTTPGNFAGLGRLSTVNALEDATAAARVDGAEVIVVLIHDSFARSASVFEADGLADPPDLWLGGHRHAVEVNTLLGAPFVESGRSFSHFARVRFDLDDRGAVTVGEPELVEVTNGLGVAPDPDLAAYLVEVEAEVAPVFGEVVGYTERPILQNSWIQGNWVTDSWRAAYPEIELAFQHNGGLRATVDAGDITRGEVFEVLPFPNDVVIFDILGVDIKRVLRPQACTGCVFLSGGVYERVNVLGDIDLRLEDGSLIDDATVYRVATNSFIFEGGSDWLWPDHAFNIYDTGVQYGLPAVDFALTNSDGERSLHDVVDGSPRDLLIWLDELGFLAADRAATDPGLVNLVADAWLAADPQADLALGCSENLEHRVDAGALTRGELAALYPYGDPLEVYTLTGAEAQAALTSAFDGCPWDPDKCFPILAGGTWDNTGDAPVLIVDGVPVASDASLRVVLHRNLVDGTCGSGPLTLPDGASLGVTAYVALTDRVEALASSSGSPLEFDEAARGN